MVIIYIYLTIHRKYIGKTNDDNGVLLSFIYSKYIIDILTNANMHVYQHEIARVVMWTFTTPIMLKMYTDVNQIKLTDINIHYHLLAIIPHIFIVPFKGQLIYLLSTIILSIPALFFMKTLFNNRQYPFTGLFICIWSVFMMINILDILHIISPIHAHSLYNISDTMCKFICAIVISSHNDQEDYRRRTLDIQTTQFIKYMINCVDKYITDNPNLTQICKKMVMYIKNKFNSSLPIDNNNLKLELLQKILPFGLDTNYINNIKRSKSNNFLLNNRAYTNICILFMDIVNYTELSSRYSGETIFKLLDTIYTNFDTIIKKYNTLQKIETIGDAYMVVGDIYNNTTYTTVIKEIILFGLEIIKEIKNIETPDNNKLSIRVGINIGDVTIGILGNENPRLCIIGHHVNLASRIQSTAEIDTIHISNEFYNIAKTLDINVTYKHNQNIFLKNIGSVDTWTIVEK
jgi:hypothetical protein